MGLATDVNNIRYNGTGRAYAGPVGGSSFDDLGEMETLNFGVTVSTEKLKSTRNAARATILAENPPIAEAVAKAKKFITQAIS